MSQPTIGRTDMRRLVATPRAEGDAGAPPRIAERDRSPVWALDHHGRSALLAWCEGCGAFHAPEIACAAAGSLVAIVCPWCGTPLLVAAADARSGWWSERCPTCRAEAALPEGVDGLDGVGGDWWDADGRWNGAMEEAASTKPAPWQPAGSALGPRGRAVGRGRNGIVVEVAVRGGLDGREQR